MPLSIDLSSEDAPATLITEAFLKSVKQNLGFDPETPDTDLPVDLTDLLHEAIAICEREQWRFILRKTATLILPYEAFTAADRLVFLPFGSVSSLITFTYKKSDGTTGSVSASGYTVYSQEPTRLWAADWTALLSGIDTDQPYPVTITYRTGYASYEAIPKPTVRALKILAYHLFEYRDAVSESKMMELPQGYCQLRDLNLLNSMRAIQYVAEDWKKVGRG